MQNQEAYQDFFIYVPPQHGTQPADAHGKLNTPPALHDPKGKKIQGKHWEEIPVHDTFVVYARKMKE